MAYYGFCPFVPLREHLLPCRAAVRLPEGAQTVIVALFPYRYPDRPGRNLSRYACVPDYHEAAGGLLRAAAQQMARQFPSYCFEAFIDNSPLPEVEAACRAGLGVRGDHGLLIHRQFGSYVFIGEIVTDAPLPVRDREPAVCPHCGACAAACPSGCVGGDRERCLSRVSQRKGELTGREQDLLRRGGLVWGCDICQEACPLNAVARIHPHPVLAPYRPRLADEDLECLEGKAYGWRGKAVLQRNLTILQGEKAEI